MGEQREQSYCGDTLPVEVLGYMDVVSHRTTVYLCKGNGELSRIVLEKKKKKKSELIRCFPQGNELLTSEVIWNGSDVQS